MAIAVGTDCVDLNTTQSVDVTIIDLETAANATGTINEIQMWPNTNISVGIVGSFFLVSGTTYENTAGRATARDLSATAGSCDTIVGGGVEFTDFAIDATDFIGANWDSGILERNSAGGSGASDFDNGAANFGSAVSYNTSSFRYSFRASGVEGNGAAGIEIFRRRIEGY